MSKQELKQKGFTIIEVVLVLAIAALIFLMVFIALPALQKGQRDTQRKDDLSRITTQIQNYAGNNRGSIPKGSTITTATTGFVSKYLGGVKDQAGSEYNDPKTGNGYVFTGIDGATAGNEPTDVGEITYYSSAKCGTDGAVTDNNGTATARDYAIQIKLENQTAVYCLGS